MMKYIDNYISKVEKYMLL